MDKSVVADSLIKLLNRRANIAEAFTKNFHEEVKRNISDYEAKSTPLKSGKSGVYNRHVTNSRYDITIPYIFATHESMTSAFFDNLPDIVISGRNNQTGKVEMIKAVYEYFKDKADLDEFLGVSAWWFFLAGLCKADVSIKQEISGYAPQLDSQGNPMVDENGEAVEVPVYSYNDPVVEVDNLLKVSFSPESEYSIDGKKVPYYIKERLVDIDEIKEVYGVEVEADEEIEVDGADKDTQGDLKRAKVRYFYGKLPSSMTDELKKYQLKWSYNQNYKVYFTKEVILLIEEIDDKGCKLARFYTNMKDFFGFGIGKTLRPFQEDMSIRRSQQIAYADRFAFPWLMLPNGVKVDQKSIMDYKKTTPMSWSGDGQAPSYLVPPSMPSTIVDADNFSRSDAQFISGTLDLSKGAQNTNTVKTATGQQLFAQSQDKRLNKARKAIAKYYREVVIEMFKLARDNWDDQKKIYYTNEDGDEMEMIVDKASLQDIDFDTEIDFNLDSVSVNKDTESQRWISLLETSMTLPFADQQKIYAKVLRESFRIENPESYIKEETLSEPTDNVDNPSANVENPETTPEDQTIGEQLAPQAPYVG